MVEDESDSRRSRRVQNWVDSFLDNEESIRNFFDRISSMQYEDEKARELLRNFARESKPQEAIAAIHFTMVELDSFFEDVRSEYGEDVIDRLEKFASDYSHLEEEINVVYAEKYFDKINPVTSGSSDISHISTDGNPFINLMVYSGDTLALEVQDRPSKLMNLSALVVHNVDRTLTNDSGQWELSEEEKTEIIHEIEHIEKHLEELKETAKIGLEEGDTPDISEENE